MDARYYEILRQASQEDLYNSINDPEDELYDIIWDLFEKVVIEPAEIFEPDFRDRNQFRYSIELRTTLEFFPDPAYFRKRLEPNPYKDDSDAAGIHLRFSLLPDMSCLFSVGFQVWGASERRAFRRLWKKHRQLLTDVFKRCKPMISTKVPYSVVEHSRTVQKMLDNYFSIKDSENFVALDYSFTEADESDVAQNFMVVMSLLYHSIRDYCQNKEDRLSHRFGQLKDYYSSHIPELPVPLPCVELAIPTDAE
jgi:hypothetical protein